MKDKEKQHPPVWADKLLRWFCADQYYEEIQGDLHEWFYRRVRKQGNRKARIFYFIDVIKFFRTFRLKAFNRQSGKLFMLNHYLRFTTRIWRKDKLTTFIQIGNLSIAFFSITMIYLYLNYELGFDRYHTKIENLYRLEHVYQGKQWASTSFGAGPYGYENFKEINNYTRIIPVNGSPWVRFDEKIFREEGIIYADQGLFDLFTFNFINGDASTALAESNSIIITQSVSTKYFGDASPLGKHLYLELDSLPREITGVMQDVPDQSHFQFDFVIPIQSLSPNQQIAWGSWSNYTYLEIESENDHESATSQIATHYDGQYKKEPGSFKVIFKPVKDIHLYSQVERELSANGNINYLYILLTASLFTVLVAVINFTNLTTIKFLDRTKEIALRKSLGANSGSLVKQLLFETCLAFFIGILAAGILVFLTFPFFRDLAGMSLEISSIVDVRLTLPLVLFMITVLSYCVLLPYSLVMKLKTVEATGNIKADSPRNSFMNTKLLMILQFCLSTLLIVGSFVIYKQLNHINSVDLGIDEDQLLMIPLNQEIKGSFNGLRDELLRYPSINSVASASHVPGFRIGLTPVNVESLEEPYGVRLLHASPEITETLGISIEAGRDFTSTDFDDKEGGEWIINTAAAEMLFEDQDPLGKKISNRSVNGTVVGVVSNFNFESLHTEITPLLLFNNKNWKNYALVNFNKESFTEVVQAIRKSNKLLFPESPPLDLIFMDQQFESMYKAEINLRSVILMFCIISIILTFSGVFGLTVYLINVKAKEVAIRKILGSGIKSIITLANRSIIRLALLSLIFSLPVAYYFLSWWLQQFAYKISLTWEIIVFGCLSLLILVAIGSLYATISLLTANPVKALRAE